MDYVAKFCRVINNLLRKGSSKGFIGRLEFRHDIYRHLFGNKFSLERKDFDHRYFKKGWDQSYRMFSCTASGVLVVFLIEVQLYIGWLGGGRFCYHNGEFLKKCSVDSVRNNVQTPDNYIILQVKINFDQKKCPTMVEMLRKVI